MNNLERLKESANSYQLPYVALMTIICVFFMLMYSYYLKLKADSEKTDISQVAQSVKSAIEDEKGMESAPKVELINDTIKIQLPDSIIFDSGKSEIKDTVKPMLEKISSEFIKLSDYYQVIVDGHTDDSPVWYGGDFSSNWELSLFRAISLIDYFVGLGNSSNRFVGMGHSEYRPLAPNDSKENRLMNRRVEIIVRRRHEKYTSANSSDNKIASVNEN